MSYHDEQFREARANIFDQVLDLFDGAEWAKEVNGRWSIHDEDYQKLRAAASAAFRAMEGAERESYGETEDFTLVHDDE